MATTTAVAEPAAAKLPPAKGRAGIGGALRSEWTKIRTVRSTYFTLLALIVIGVGLGALICYATQNHIMNMNHGKVPPGFDPTMRSLVGFVRLGSLVMVVLGALVMTAEYSTGMIRTSLTAQPRRGTVFAAKLLVFAVIAVVVSAVTSLAAFFTGQQVLKPLGSYATISDPNVARAIVGVALYVTLIGLLAYAFGSIIRHTAGAIATMVGVIFVLPLIVEVLPSNWVNDITRWLPTSSADAIVATVGPQDPNLFSPWVQLGVTAGYAAVLLIVGAVLLAKRDA